MQVEEKPDVTYSDVGGCKEQIEKLREVVETPLLHVCITILACVWMALNTSDSLSASSNLVSTRRKASYSLDLQVPARRYVPVR